MLIIKNVKVNNIFMYHDMLYFLNDELFAPQIRLTTKVIALVKNSTLLISNILYKKIFGM